MNNKNAMNFERFIFIVTWPTGEWTKMKLALALGVAQQYNS